MKYNTIAMLAAIVVVAFAATAVTLPVQVAHAQDNNNGCSSLSSPVCKGVNGNQAQGSFSNSFTNKDSANGNLIVF